MVRHKINNYPISVAYGDDPTSGVFLTVTDSRLRYNPNASAQVNAVTKMIGIGDGGGSYFDLHTGQIGFGTRVDDETMAAFLRRYGVPEHQIRDLPLQLTEVSNPTSFVPGSSCSVCFRATKKTCGSCHDVRFCSKACQASHWPVHRIFCNIKYPTSGPDTAIALLLPERSETPVWVKLLCTLKQDDEGPSFWDLETDQHIPGFRSFNRAGRIGNELIIQIVHKDDYLVDGVSQSNQCIQRIISRSDRVSQLPIGYEGFWRNNILITKTNLDANPVYYDLLPEDVPIAIEHLIRRCH